jgi:hypothetical protein
MPWTRRATILSLQACDPFRINCKTATATPTDARDHVVSMSMSITDTDSIPYQPPFPTLVPCRTGIRNKATMSSTARRGANCSSEQQQCPSTHSNGSKTGSLHKHRSVSMARLRCLDCFQWRVSVAMRVFEVIRPDKTMSFSRNVAKSSNHRFFVT